MTRRRRSTRFTMWTSANASGSYRGWERALGSARWVAAETDTTVLVASDDSGETWDVSPDGSVAPHVVR